MGRGGGAGVPPPRPRPAVVPARRGAGQARENSIFSKSCTPLQRPHACNGMARCARAVFGSGCVLVIGSGQWQRTQTGTVLRVLPTAVIAVAVTAGCSCRPRPGILRLGKDCRAPSDMSRQTAPDLSLFFSLTRCGDTHDNIRIDKHSIPSLTARHYNDARRCRCSRRCRCCHYAVNKGHTGPHASCSAYWSWLDCRSSCFCASSFQAGSFRVIAQRIVQCHAGINLNTALCIS